MVVGIFNEVIGPTVAACQQVNLTWLGGEMICGSVARERMRHDSDLDLLVVAEPLPHGRLPRDDEVDQVENLVALQVLVEVSERLSRRRATRHVASDGRLGLDPYVRPGDVVVL